MQRGSVRKLMAVGGCAGIAAVVAACGGSSSNSPSASSSGSGGGIPSGLSVNSFDVNFSVMSQFKGLVSSGKGLVGVILPDTTSSTRYVQFDQPYLTKAFTN
jgi:D-xylose transport system substrate-binding protein